MREKALVFTCAAHIDEHARVVGDPCAHQLGDGEAVEEVVKQVVRQHRARVPVQHVQDLDLPVLKRRGVSGAVRVGLLEWCRG